MILVPDSSSVKQGEILRARLLIKETDGTSGFGGIKHQTLGKVLYLYHVGPFIMKQGVLESEVKVLFSKVPTSNSVTEVIQGEQVTISWSEFQVIPTQESEGFQFGTFEIPKMIRWLPWLIGALTILILFFIIARWKKRQAEKKQVKHLRAKMKEELMGAKTYEDIVQLWQKKRVYLKQFPSIEENFKKLEETLFKFQFKPQRNESEIFIIQASYEKFKQDIPGALNGI